MTPLDNSCPRATTYAYIRDHKGHMLGVGKNCLPDELSPCSCNTHNPDTNEQGSSTCMAIHAEIKALLGAQRLAEKYNTRLHTLLVTRPPCRQCIKILLHTDITEIFISGSDYPDRDGTQAVWEKTGRKWEYVNNGK